MALDCAEELTQFGKRIRDATDFYVHYLRDTERSISVSALIDEYLINVSASKSKTAKRRLIQIAPNLAEWLRPYTGRSGKIFPYSHRWYHLSVDLLRKAIGLTEWPNNGFRHSFASYHLAKHQNAPQLALEMGHTTPRRIFDNYREVVTPEEAERYWNVRPKREDNVISMERVG